jgi:glycosyltransferase involved in cell wall biosynthesis
MLPNAKTAAILTPTYPPYRGGIGKVAEADAEQLVALGFEVTVCAPGTERGRRGNVLMRPLTALARWGNGAFVPGAVTVPKRHGVTVLHYPFFGGAEPLAVGRRLGVGGGKVVLTYHMDVEGTGLLKPFIAAHSRWWMPSIVRMADRILVTSLDYARSSRVATLLAEEPERFRELPPAVDVRNFSPGKKSDALLAKYGITTAERVVVFVGGLDRAHYFKGVPNLLAALATRELAGVRAVIVGDGDLRSSFEALARTYGLGKRVAFAGGVADSDLADHYRLGDVFAFPSIDRSEAFGIAALEALSCGVSVVASDLPGVRTIVRDGDTGLLTPPGSASALAGRLRRLLDDVNGRRMMGEAGRRMAVTEYSEERRLERWRTILAELGQL